MSKKLTDADLCRAAREIGCSTGMIKAVDETESSGSGFLPDGKIKIRFEGHKFRDFTHRRYDESHPRVSYPWAVQEHKTHGYGAFNEAFELDPEAAMLATSWGRFQPMGFTHEEAGFDTVGEFVDFLKQSEGNQLLVFVRMVKHRRLDDELRRGTLKDCTVFARNYNGPGYAGNAYHTKIYNRKVKYEANPIDCEDSGTAPAVVVEPTVEPTNPPTITNSEPAEASTLESGPSPSLTTVEQYIPQVKKVTRALGGGAVSSFFAAAYTTVTGWQPWQVAVFGFIGGIFLASTVAVIIFHRNKVFGLVKEAMGINANPALFNVKLTTEKPV